MQNSVIILIVGASGAGKDSLLKAAKKRLSDGLFNFVPRFIDRMPDSNEENFYIDSSSFNLLGDFFISKWQANEHNYGIATHFIKPHCVNIISISRSAIKDFESAFKNVFVIEIYVPLSLLKTRLESRGREDSKEIEKRLANAKKKVVAKNLVRFNNAGNFTQGVKKFCEVIESITLDSNVSKERETGDRIDSIESKTQNSKENTKFIESNNIDSKKNFMDVTNVASKKNLVNNDISKDSIESKNFNLNFMEDTFVTSKKDSKNIESKNPFNFFTTTNNPSKILHFLGSSDSSGIPTHNCKCKACESYRKANKTNLSTCAFIPLDSIYLKGRWVSDRTDSIESQTQEFILLDCGIEEISNIFDGCKIAAIFLTHFHADHALGLLRLRYSKDKIICYHPNDESGFGDLFKHKKNIIYRAMQPFERVQIANFTFTALPLIHSKPTFGYFIESNIDSKGENIAYLTDCAGIPKETLDFLKNKNINILYIDAGAFIESNQDSKKIIDSNLQDFKQDSNNFLESKTKDSNSQKAKKDSNNHLSHIEATKIINELNPKQARLIHISHKILSTINNHTLPYPYIL